MPNTRFATSAGPSQGQPRCEPGQLPCQYVGTCRSPLRVPPHVAQVESLPLGHFFAEEEKLEMTMPEALPRTKDNFLGEAQNMAPGTTTLYIARLPRCARQDALIELWPAAENSYDFIYLPFNIKQLRTSGHAFINFTSHEAAAVFRDRWHGKTVTINSRSVSVAVGVAHVQGLLGNLNHLKRCCIESITNDKYLPAVFTSSHRIDFREFMRALPGQDTRPWDQRQPQPCRQAPLRPLRLQL